MYSQAQGSESASFPDVKNCIFWENTDAGDMDPSAQIDQDSSSTTDVNYSIIQGGWTGPGGNNKNVDPMFEDLVSGDLHLKPNSPAIDMGTNEALSLLLDTCDLDGDGDTAEHIPFDLDGNPRIVNGIVDMSAYEFQVSCPCSSFTVTDFQPPMGKKKKPGSTLPIKFTLFHDGEEILGQELLDTVLEKNGCAPSCPVIAIYYTDGGGQLLEDTIPENVGDIDTGNCFRFSNGNWVYNLRLDASFLYSGDIYEVRVELDKCELTPGNSRFQIK